MKETHQCYAQKELNTKLDEIPNLPHYSVPKGKDEKDNVIIREWGSKKVFNFTEKTHLELSKDLGLIDLERGAKISGSGFPIYTGKGAKLERSLINSMIDHHTEQYGFTEIFPSVLILEESMRTTGQLPKFKEDMYLSELDNLYLAPTAEVPITNMHRQEIISESELPINYVAYSPCFRRESGSYGKDTRGLLRLHQFNKVEMVKFVKPENSYDALEDLVLQAESILKILDSHKDWKSIVIGDEPREKLIFKHKNLLIGVTTCALFVSTGCMQNLANSNFSPTSSFNTKQINSESDGIVALKEVFDSSVEKIPTLTAVGYAVVSSQPGRSQAQKRLMAIRSSRMSAMRELAEQIHGIQVDSNTTVIDLMVQNDTFRAVVKGVIRGAKTVRINPTGNDTYETVLEIDRDMMMALSLIHI